MLKLIFIDSEYLSLSKEKSSFHEINKNKKILFPEIFQFALIKTNLDLKLNKIKKINFYIKTKNKIPNRLIKLTNYNPLKKNLILFKKFIKKMNILSYKNQLIVVNGDDIKLLKMNMKFNKIKLSNKKIRYLNLRSFLKKIYNKEFTTAELKRKFIPNNSTKLHNALNDCVVLIKALKIIKNKKKNQSFEKLILKNSSEIKI